MPDNPAPVTRLIAAVRAGETEAMDRLFEVVYEDLKRRAHAQLGGSPRTLDTTALVHEAYLKLSGSGRPDWADAQHFFRVAARAMRQIVIDRARSRLTAKRGGGQAHLDLDRIEVGADSAAEQIVALDDALSRLSWQDPRLAAVVELRFFGGLTVEETARSLDVSERTVKRDWRLARAFLHGVLTEDGGHDG
jgi:RNA polymerase sigma factor (TIGR02999 family)